MEAGKQIWHASLQDHQSCHVFGVARGRTELDLDLKLGISDIYSAESIRDKHGFNQVNKNFIHGSSSTLGAAGVNLDINQTHEGQSSKGSLDLTLDTKMEDPKRLRRMMANRIYSRKYRLKKLQQMEELEKLRENIWQRVSNLRRENEEVINMRQALMIERHNLKFTIAALENKSVAKNAEVANNMAEVKRLTELLSELLSSNQFQANTQHAMPNSDDGHAANAELDLNLSL